MFTEFSAAPLSPSSTDILREVQHLLNQRGITFGALIVYALQDTVSSLGTAIILDLANVLEALHLKTRKPGRCSGSFSPPSFHLSSRDSAGVMIRFRGISLQRTYLLSNLGIST